MVVPMVPVLVLVVVGETSGDGGIDDNGFVGEGREIGDVITDGDDVISVIVVVTDIVEERLDVSVRLGQPTDCTSLHTGEEFFTASNIVSSELKLFSTLTKLKP